MTFHPSSSVVATRPAPPAFRVPSSTPSSGPKPRSSRERWRRRAAVALAALAVVAAVGHRFVAKPRVAQAAPPAGETRENPPIAGDPATAERATNVADAPQPEDVPADPSKGQGGKAGVFVDAKISVKGKTREYRLIVPKSIDPAKPVPLAFAFHGLGDSTELMSWYSGLSKLAEKKGFILVYPEAKNRYWPLAVGLAGDDLAFFDELYATLTAQYNVDRHRVYVLGMSNGGYFSHLIASERPDKVAAIVCHSGGLGLFAFGKIDVKPKYSVLVVHGDKDLVVGVDEGRKVRDAYQKWGHPVEYLEIPGWHHLWAFNKNETIWDFLRRHPLTPAENPAK